MQVDVDEQDRFVVGVRTHALDAHEGRHVGGLTGRDGELVKLPLLHTDDGNEDHDEGDQKLLE